MPALSITEAYNVLRPLGIFVLEMVIYSIFIFKFYRFIARRDIIKVNLSRHKNAGLRFIRWIIYLIQNILVFPLIIFLGFTILVLFLGFLGKNQTPESIMLVSIALISAIRLSAYYSEDLSRDLAKMLPFALLGVYIVDQSYFEFSVSLDHLKAIPEYWRLLIYYFAFILVLEMVLRVFHSIVSLAKGKQKPPSVIIASGQS
jgi:hypothetical protein